METHSFSETIKKKSDHESHGNPQGRCQNVSNSPGEENTFPKKENHFRIPGVFFTKKEKENHLSMKERKNQSGREEIGSSYLCFAPCLGRGSLVGEGIARPMSR